MYRLATAQSSGLLGRRLPRRESPACMGLAIGEAEVSECWLRVQKWAYRRRFRPMSDTGSIEIHARKQTSADLSNPACPSLSCFAARA